jgi:RNA polymerase sigma factor (sigma-70 family)
MVARREYLSFRRAQALDLSRLLVLGRHCAEETAALPSADAAALDSACARLSDADREVLLLTSVEGLDSEAAAEALGISGAALRQRLARARRRLARLLEQDEALPAPNGALPRKGTGP